MGDGTRTFFEMAIHFRARPNLRKDFLGNIEEFTELRGPLPFVEVEEEGPGGVGHVGHVGPRQVPDEPSVDGSKEKGSLVQGFLRLGDVFQEPSEFESTEVGVDGQSGLSLEVVL